VACIGEETRVYKVLVVKLEGKRPLGRLRLRWEDEIRMDLRKTGWEGMAWFQLDQDRKWWWALVNVVMILRVVVSRS
jgi:hypothetical protein